MTVKLIKTFNQKVIKNKKGNLIKYVSKKDKYFKKFGEIYFNEIKFKKKKGLTKHKLNNCIIKCLCGKVKFHFIDQNNNELKIIINSKQNKVLKIPPNIWFNFESISGKSLIANLIERVHSDKEIIKSDKVNNYLIK